MKRVGLFCFCALILITFTGCVLPFTGSVQEIVYCGQLPKSLAISRQDAISLANDFASETGMIITDISPASRPYNDKSIDISLGETNQIVTLHFSQGAKPITAGITIDATATNITIIVYGDPNSLATKDVAHKGVELFQKKFPEGSIAPYTPHKNWFERNFL